MNDIALSIVGKDTFMDDFSVFGNNLKDTRTKMGLSLSEVSNLTGVSKTMLSQIERGESTPTIATVWRIANGLKIKFETLLGNTDHQCEVRSIENMVSLTDDDDLMNIYCIFPFSPLSGLELFYGILKPGCNYYSESHINSVSEYLMVVQGEIELQTGSAVYHIPAGSALSFDSRKEHKYIHRGTEDAKVLFIVSYE